MKNWKGLQMKKITSLVVASFIAVSSYAPAAHAWGAREQGILTGVAGLWVFQQLNKPPVVVQQPAPVYVPQPQVVYVYPTTAPIVQFPNTSCELRSEYINGQVITGNFCYQR